MLFAQRKATDSLLFSLFSLLSSLEKVAEGNGERREKRKAKSEENKKKKPLARLFLFVQPVEKRLSRGIMRQPFFDGLTKTETSEKSKKPKTAENRRDDHPSIFLGRTF